MTYHQEKLTVNRALFAKLHLIRDHGSKTRDSIDRTRTSTSKLQPMVRDYRYEEAEIRVQEGLVPPAMTFGLTHGSIWQTNFASW
jgi:hypothetical protein